MQVRESGGMPQEQAGERKEKLEIAAAAGRAGAPWAVVGTREAQEWASATAYQTSPPGF